MTAVILTDFGLLLTVSAHELEKDQRIRGFSFTLLYVLDAKRRAAENGGINCSPRSEPFRQLHKLGCARSGQLVLLRPWPLERSYLSHSPEHAGALFGSGDSGNSHDAEVEHIHDFTGAVEFHINGPLQSAATNF
jgi:hypothetical protein